MCCALMDAGGEFLEVRMIWGFDLAECEEFGGSRQSQYEGGNPLALMLENSHKFYHKKTI